MTLPCRFRRKMVISCGLCVHLVLVMVVSTGHAVEPLSNSKIAIENGLVRAEFQSRNGLIAQRYYARQSDDWELICESFSPPSEFPEQGNSLYDSEADPKHRVLTTRTLTKIERSSDGQEVFLRGASPAGDVVQTVKLKPGDSHFHVTVDAKLASVPPKVDYVLSPFTFVIDGPPDYTHVPAHKRNADNLIADRVFYAPAAIAQRGRRMVALVPDVDAINKYAVPAQNSRQHPDSDSFPVEVAADALTLPAVLDLELESGLTRRPLLACGLSDCFVKQHVFWLRDNKPGAMVRELSRSDVRYEFDLFVSADAVEQRGYQAIAQYQWKRFGADYFKRPLPQAMPLERYARFCYPAYFSYQGYQVVSNQQITHTDEPDRRDLDSWQEWDVNGMPAGAFRLTAPQWYDLAYNTSWWNNVCDATGLYYWGKRLGDPSLVDKARRVINFTLSAPQNRGLFPSLYDLKKKTWLRSLWNPPAEDYDPDKTIHIWDSGKTGGAYMTASASTTAAFLMQFYATCEADERIISYVERFGDFLIAHMQPSGNVPAWFDESLVPRPSMRDFNADGGVHVWVLAELYRQTGEAKYLTAARKIASFLINNVIPEQRWSDFETFYSCAVKPENYFDPRTGQPGRDLMAVSWAMSGLSSLYEVTEEQEYLSAAEAVADFASLFQAVWAPHFIVTAYPFGGMCAQLGDAEWLDQRDHRFAGPFVQIGLLTGRQDLVERGIAASRSSLTHVNHPRHSANSIYNHSNFPAGLGPENIDHEGFPQMPLSSGPSWSSVGGLAAAAHVGRQLGGAYVNLERNIQVGVDGVRLRRIWLNERTLHLQIENALAQLSTPFDVPFTIELRVVGLPDVGKYLLVVNNRAPQEISGDELAALSFEVQP